MKTIKLTFKHIKMKKMNKDRYPLTFLYICFPLGLSKESSTSLKGSTPKCGEELWIYHDVYGY